MNLKLVLIVIVYLKCDSVSCHGLLLNPINRASLWRLNSSVPIDYNDNQGFCGGFQVQWEINNGKCGICGDDYRYSIPRPHENHGEFGQGIIVANYNQGSTIKVTTLITANHLGWYQLSLCRLDDTQIETDECFKNLEFTNGNNVYEVPDDFVGLMTTEISLPENVTCKHCVLRWHYRTGNNWGICEDGTEGRMGCGPQETFRTCSDISIT